MPFRINNCDDYAHNHPANGHNQARIFQVRSLKPIEAHNAKQRTRNNSAACHLSVALFIFSSNVRVLAEARFGADSQEPLVRLASLTQILSSYFHYVSLATQVQVGDRFLWVNQRERVVRRHDSENML